MSDEVSQFLEQVERLRGQQIEEDEVRAKELEDYLAAKRERQARREERARSISPQKSSPANTPSPRSNRRSIHLSEALKLESPVPVENEESSGAGAPAEPEGKQKAMSYPLSSPTKENESPENDTKPTPRPPSRGSALSWQQRPKSRSGGRPLSMLATQNATQRSLTGSQEPSPASATEQSFNKDQITQALGSKDPAWFRQTADRGANSAAYRKNQVEDEDRLDMSLNKAQLPGMAADKPKPEPILSTPTKNRLVSPPMLNPPRFDGPTEDKSFSERSVTPTGRTSPFRSNSRSNSPTKGVGGFVQSAMMKRSDSVKRWSVTSPPGLARVDSIASSRSGALPPTSRARSHTRSESRTPGSSRPASRHGEEEGEGDATPKGPTIDTSTPRTEDRHLPTSPTKTMDPRRWSPTKASWLESALNKPESPKPQHKSNTSQPAWMAELNKNKAEKSNNAELGKSQISSISHRHQVSIGGLMRSTPMGDVAKPNTTGLGGIYSPPPGGNRPKYGYAGLNLSKSAPKFEQKNEEEKPAEPVPIEPVPDPELTPAEEAMKAQTPEKPEFEEKPQEPEKEEKAKSPSVATPPALKPKPETPPKKDFRGSLRHRPTGSDAPKTEEPEFKSVFGTLRRTKTQNYVAPDELKSNILRGKAALNATGGPQKSERVDEFKEAILKKKDDFKKAQAEGKSIARSATVSVAKSVPEGLSKRVEIAKKREPALETKPALVPAKPASPKPASPKPIPGPKRIPSQPALTPKSPSAVTEPAPKPAAEPRPLPVLQKETSAPSRLQGRVGGGKLADRFNPGLAGLLARGPPPMATNGGQSNDDSESRGPSGGSSEPVTEPTTAGPQLTHMTKGRARGPRRKAPTAAATSAPAKAPTPETKPEPVAPAPIEVKKELLEKPAPVEKVEQTKPAAFSIQQQAAAKVALRGKPTPVRKPESEITPAAEDKVPSFPRKQTGIPEPETSDYPSPLRIQKTGDASRPGSPKKLDTNRVSRFMDESASTPEPARLTHQRTGSRSPIKMFQRPFPEPEAPSTPKPQSRPLPEPGSSSPQRRPLPEPQPSSPNKVDSDPVVSVRNGAALFGGAVLRTPPSMSKSSVDDPASELEVAKTPSRVAVRPLPVPPAKEPKSPPVVTSPPPRQGTPSMGNDVASLFSDFFGPKQERTTPYRVDTAELLSNRPSEGGKIQPLSFQTFQISGEGKKTPVASHFERVLFEQEMYICPHSFANEAGWKRLEIYFWVGDDVPESASQEALVFVQKEVKTLGAKLVRIQQGKETAEFLQAMGGVIIVRRGSSKKFDSLASNMLCGRRFLGQVAFDEVDFAPVNLCAGFPYLLTKGGNCYLWKGKGSDVAELSCARLIGMELSLTGELIEYDDGNEPVSFWKLFEGGSKLGSADHWRLKPNYAKYCSRLFCSDADTRQQIFEVTPFNQRDLSREHIYVLDAFFEMYIIVGSKAQTRYTSFRNALDFAQEYAILASGLEDRPFVPISTVVLEGIPRDLKRVFRSWRDELSPTASHTAAPALLSTPKRGRSLRVVSLTQALQALSE